MSELREPLLPAQRARVGMWIRLARCYNLAMRELAGGMRDECTMPQFDVLAQLARSEDGLTFSALSERLLVTAGNLTGIVDRLEKRDLVRRETNPRDRRQIFVRLTPQGRLYCAKVIPEHEQKIVALFAGMAENDVQNLRADLDKIATLFEKAAGRP